MLKKISCYYFKNRIPLLLGRLLIECHILRRKIVNPFKYNIYIVNNFFILLMLIFFINSIKKCLFQG